MSDIDVGQISEALNNKADLNSPCTINVPYTFAKCPEMVSGINLKNNSIRKGTVPTDTVYWGIRANDKTSPGSSWQNARLGVLEWYLNSSNVTGLTLSAYKNGSDATAAASISLQYHGNESKPKILINGKEMVAFVTETWRSGTEWYRKYSDGWVEQGGSVNATQYNTTTQNVNFKIAMADTNYYANACPNTTNHQETWAIAARVAVKTTSGMAVHGANNANAAYTGPCSWEVKGFAA